MPDARYALSAEGVSKSFGRLQVLKSASVRAEAGKVTTLMGRNGSGKTTLLKIAAGVMRADQGVVSFLGAARARPSLAHMARAGLMYVPQERLGAPNRTVRQHLRAIVSTFRPADVGDVLADANVEALMDRRIASLSGGERMRVSMTLARVRKPKVLIADEPLVGLSPIDQEAAGAFLRRLARDGAAVVTSGHDTRVLLSVSDVVLWSVAGTTHHLGSPDEAQQHEQFCRQYLGPRHDFNEDLDVPDAGPSGAA